MLSNGLFLPTFLVALRWASLLLRSRTDHQKVILSSKYFCSARPSPSLALSASD